MRWLITPDEKLVCITHNCMSDERARRHFHTGAARLSAERKEHLQIPRELLEKIFLSNGAHVRDFLAHKLPRERASSFFIHPEQYFSNKQPSSLDFDPTRLQTPPASVIRALANTITDSKGSAETHSNACPHIPGNHNTYPLWLSTVQSWVKKDHSDVLSKDTLKKIQVLSWDSSLRRFTNSNALAVLSSHCNRSWLRAAHIDQMLELLEAEGLNLEDDGNKSELYFFDPQYLDLRNLGAEFVTGNHKKLGTIANINNDHWVALVVDFVAETVHYGDSFGGGFNASLRGAYDWYIEQHTDKKFHLIIPQIASN
ncbi:hypothetical protein DFH08DRAFT_827863 [Mycena albidolilacea]|uniref:Ubiquitin-like protease family profile domain-containing protein n=1 Tax=Mycena albidolilacea TaxID=1033008 RepID=A0AAD6YX56_9AGAR|nr:hypothetical protein DFH08DRAFT_827863 [Mycena albidolilacea]